jgi:hypothetical protein
VEGNQIEAPPTNCARQLATWSFGETPGTDENSLSLAQLDELSFSARHAGELLNRTFNEGIDASQMMFVLFCCALRTIVVS